MHRNLTRALAGALATVLAGAAAAQSPDAPAPADRVFVNGLIYKVDAERGWAEAAAIRGGRFVRVGDNADVAPLIGPETRVDDLGGRMAMPGIHDMHVHPTDGGIKALYDCGFPFTTPLARILERVADCAAEAPEGAWVRGGQWATELLESDNAPTRAMLDAVVPEHPVYLMDSAMHGAWVNTRALERLGVTAGTPDPNGGVIQRDPRTGEPTGILLDNAAYEAMRELPPRTQAQYEAAIRWAVETLNGLGVTAMKDAVATGGAVRAYAALDRAGELNVRVATSLPWKAQWTDTHAEERENIARRGAHRTARVRTDFAKIFLDGIPPTRTAAFLEPYRPDEAHGAEYRGELIHDPATLAEDVTWLDARGLTVKMHATGTRSARVGLDAIAAARAANGPSGLHHEIAHASYLHPDDYVRFAELNAIAELSPILWYPGPLIGAMESTLGRERARRMWPIRALQAAGAHMVYGSDWPSVVPDPSPWPGIEAMVTRRDPYGKNPGALWADQAIDLATAVEIFTRNGARAMRMEDLTGSIEPGKSADLIVLDRNLFTVEPTKIGDTRVLMTVLEGETVFERDPAKPPPPPR